MPITNPNPSLILPAPGHESLAASLADCAGADLGRIESRRFPDGETYLRIGSDVAGRDVMVVATLVDPDPQLAGLLFLADTAKELGAAHVGLVTPYLAYMRQDSRFRDGESVTSRTFARVLSAAFDWIATVDPHLHRYDSLDAIYTIPGIVARASPAIAHWIRENVKHPLVIGPDSESDQWVADVAARASAPLAVMSKHRVGDRQVKIHAPGGISPDWKDRTPVLVDDIISSGHTMAEAARVLIHAGFAEPVCIGVHALFAPDAERTLQAAGFARVVTCNTVPHSTNQIDVLPQLIQTIRDSGVSTALASQHNQQPAG
jgi:ribose-phosphate pyrophosphokinase